MHCEKWKKICVKISRRKESRSFFTFPSHIANIYNMESQKKRISLTLCYYSFIFKFQRHKKNAYKLFNNHKMKNKENNFLPTRGRETKTNKKLFCKQRNCIFYFAFKLCFVTILQAKSEHIVTVVQMMNINNEGNCLLMEIIWDFFCAGKLWRKWVIFVKFLEVL